MRGGIRTVPIGSHILVIKMRYRTNRQAIRPGLWPSAMNKRAPSYWCLTQHKRSIIAYVRTGCGDGLLNNITKLQRDKVNKLCQHTVRIRQKDTGTRIDSGRPKHEYIVQKHRPQPEASLLKSLFKSGCGGLSAAAAGSPWINQRFTAMTIAPLGQYSAFNNI